MNLLKKILIFKIIILTFIFLCSCYDMKSIEEIDLTTGLGFDIEKDDKIKLVDPIEFLEISSKDEENGAVVLIGEGPTLYSLNENRRAKQSRKFVFGSELVFLISEERARFGTIDILDTLLRHPQTNVNAMIAVGKGKSEDFFTLKLNTKMMSEQLSSILQLSHESNFFPKHITVNEFLLMYNQQGREIYLPYLEIIEGKPQLTGTAIFRDDKMVKKVSIKEAKLINLLRSSGGKGVISILSDDLLKYLDLESENKVKVKVSKENDDLKYDIFVTISGDLRINTLYEEELNKEKISKIEKLFEEKLQKDLNDEVKKVQDEYGVDCLDISKYATAKYGRDSGYDSDEYFKNADIKVHVKVKIKSIGRNFRMDIED